MLRTSAAARGVAAPATGRAYRGPKGVAAGTNASAASQRKAAGPYQGAKAVIVGAGPAGTVLAMQLARQGFDVKVYEKRPNPEQIPMKAHRSIPLLILPEVTQILVDLGVDIPEGKYNRGITAYDTTTLIVANKINKNFKPMFSPGKRIFSERHSLASAVLATAMSQDFPNLDFIFDSPCKGVDVHSQVAQFLRDGNEIEEVGYDLLVGADGVNSQVRIDLQASGHLEFTQRKCRNRYLSVRNLEFPEEPEDELKAAMGAGCNAWAYLKSSGSSDPKVLIAYGSENGKCHAYMAGPSEGFDALKGHAIKWVSKTIPPQYPKAWHKSIAEEIDEGNLYSIGPVTYCSSCIGPNVALVGDACHSATPIMGMGANRAMLDSQDLGVALEESKGDISLGLKLYEKKCRPVIAALQELEFLNPLTRLEGQSPLWKAYFFIYAILHSQLRRVLPAIPQSIFMRIQVSDLTPQAALTEYKREAAVIGGTLATAFCFGLFFGLKAAGLLV